MPIKPKKNKSVKAWINRHVKDHYVHQAKQSGYRSRAIYKLEEIDNTYNLLHNVKTVLDLGCAPGSWLQYVVRKLKSPNTIIGVDLLLLEPMSHVEFIQGDFTQDYVLQDIRHKLSNNLVDLILSDMSPNLSGIKNVDQARMANLIEMIFDFALTYLKPQGNCVIKIFHGEEFTQLVKQARGIFTQVNIYKPSPSRSESSETYLVCCNKK